MNDSNTTDAVPVVLAAVAHPDDIEFCFAGTLLQLKSAGCEVHMWNMANGCCGSLTQSAAEIARIRDEEAKKSAELAGAVHHSPVFDDLGIFYDAPSLAATSAVVRAIRPHIVLTHSPHDYMEDHQNACRLIVTATFSRRMPNFKSAPPVEPFSHEVRIYHASPHGLRDGLGAVVEPDLLVDIEAVLERKRSMLACHRSQQSWLASTQGMNAYLEDMETMGRTLAQLCPNMGQYAEGWRRHSHLGFCLSEYDPLSAILGKKIFNRNTKANQKYEPSN